MCFKMRFNYTTLLVFVCILILAPVYILDAENEHTGDLYLQIKNVRNNKGQLLIAVFNKAEGFPDNSRYALHSFAIDLSKPLQPSIHIGRMRYGNYALSVLHDEDGNKKMTYGRLGFPKEGYGFSNNPGRLLKKPSFEQTAVSLTEKEKTIVVEMVY